MGAITTTALYTNTPGKHFDLDYYLHKHMPLAEKTWGPFGLQKWTSVCFQSVQEGQTVPYRVKTVCEWTSVEDMNSARTSAEGKAVVDDLANFTNEEAVFLVGETLASSSSA